MLLTMCLSFDFHRWSSVREGKRMVLKPTISTSIKYCCWQQNLQCLQFVPTVVHLAAKSPLRVAGIQQFDITDRIDVRQIMLALNPIFLCLMEQLQMKLMCRSVVLIIYQFKVTYNSYQFVLLILLV